MLLARLVSTSSAVAATAARREKVALLVETLSSADADEVALVVAMLAGEPRQGRIGVGWATLSAVDATTADTATITVTDLDRYLTTLEATTGPGSQARRAELLVELFSALTEAEAGFVRRLIIGELRQGALEGLMVDAVAKAAGVPAKVVRRAAMLSGDLPHAAAVAFNRGRAALEDIGIRVGTGIAPMLASTADSIATALSPDGSSSIEWKLDGIRIQVHRRGDEVTVYTRNLNIVTDRVPEIVALVRALPVTDMVLDGEAIGLHDDAPEAFQDTMSRFGRDESGSHPMQLRPFFFDCLHLDGIDLIDEPLSQRRSRLEEVAGPLCVPAITTSAADEAGAFLDDALAAGHEGVMVKHLDSPYAAGRRGKAWRKVKPVHTFDLVVLAAEWGHGRRTGWLSNLHLGARGEGDDLVMVGKTFKGLTDDVLEWQTAALSEREIGRDGITVRVRPELVVEVAVDGAQSSTRYPGGVALRFARVRRYRLDKDPGDADHLDDVRAVLAGPRSAPVDQK